MEKRLLHLGLTDKKEIGPEKMEWSQYQMDRLDRVYKRVKYVDFIASAMGRCIEGLSTV